MWWFKSTNLIVSPCLKSFGSRLSYPLCQEHSLLLPPLILALGSSFQLKQITSSRKLSPDAPRWIGALPLCYHTSDIIIVFSLHCNCLFNHLSPSLGASLVAQSVKNLPAMQEIACNAGDPGSIPGWGRSPGEGNGNPLQYSCLGNPMDPREAWWSTVPGVAKSQTPPSD